jgi:hypothetical protein
MFRVLDCLVSDSAEDIRRDLAENPFKSTARVNLPRASSGGTLIDHQDVTKLISPRILQTRI